MKTCILHIGTEKSGSTALQSWLYQNSQSLSENGIYLSHSLGFPNNRSFASYFAQTLDEWCFKNRIHDSNQKDLYFTSFEFDLRKELLLALRRHNVVVITSEHLHSRVTKKDEILGIRDFLLSVFDKVIVVCYFRPQSQMALSLYSTSLKFGHTKNLDDFMGEVSPNSYYYNFERIAENWSSVFGNENCVFKIYSPKTLKMNNIIIDFIEFLGAEYDWAIPPQNNSNPSLSKKLVQIYRYINIFIPCRPEYYSGFFRLTTLLNRSMKILSDFAFRKSKQKLKYHSLSIVQQRFDETNKRFFHKYFEGKIYF
jgi:hypothetical protein